MIKFLILITYFYSESIIINLIELNFLLVVLKINLFDEILKCYITYTRNFALYCSN